VRPVAPTQRPVPHCLGCPACVLRKRVGDAGHRPSNESSPSKYKTKNVARPVLPRHCKNKLQTGPSNGLAISKCEASKGRSLVLASELKKVSLGSRHPIRV
jgi:hypothetical protein